MTETAHGQTEKRYYTLDRFCKEKFGTKIAKITLNGGFTCPNRDGTKGCGGCIYCSEKMSGEFAGDPAEDIASQFAFVKEKLAAKWKSTRYMAYFQAGTGTYAPLERLRTLYEAALAEENVAALSVATRPDCLPEDVLDYLAELNGRTFVTVELGLQSVSDETGKRINRQTTYDEFLRAYEALSARGIAVCVHLINGLPGETREDMLHSVETVSALAPWSVKLHMLHVLRGTVCEELYRAGKLAVFEKEEYVNLVCDELEILSPDVVVQRLTGDGARSELVAPLWSVRKFELLNAIDREMARRESYQGKFCKETSSGVHLPIR